MVLKTSDVKLPKSIEDIDDLNMFFEAQRRYNQEKEIEEFAAALPYIFGFFCFAGLIFVTIFNYI